MSCSKFLGSFLNNILVETGSGDGGGIDNAIKFGFKEYYGVEIDINRYHNCMKKFKDNNNIHLFFGDSLDQLPSMLSNIREKATFLLDAHLLDPDMNRDEVRGKIVCPILSELNLIVNHGKLLGVRHSIMIDDQRFFDGKTKSFGYITIDDIRKTITDIDPLYIINVGRKMISAI